MSNGFVGHILFTFFFCLLLVSGVSLKASEDASAPSAADIFMDEGDGDLEPMPMAKESDDNAEAKPVAAAENKKSQPKKAKSVKPSEPAEKVVKARAESASKPVAKAASAKPSRKVASAESSVHGRFAVTNGPCTMSREPASESPVLLTVRDDKRIWVEDVDAQWVRAFNKAGEPGYIQRNCLKK